MSAGVLDTKSDFIIVPCTALYNSILRTSETINGLITDYTSDEDKEQVESALKSSFKNLNNNKKAKYAKKRYKRSFKRSK